MNRGEKKKEKNSRKAQFHASFFPTFLRTTAILFRVRVIPLLGRNPMKRKGPIGSKGEGWRTNEKAEEKKEKRFELIAHLVCSLLFLRCCLSSIATPKCREFFEAGTRTMCQGNEMKSQNEIGGKKNE